MGYELEALRMSRMKCAEEGQEKVETCAENINSQLDRMRTERDEQLVVVRTKHEQQIEREMTAGKNQLIMVQAQLTEQLKNIREHHDGLLEKIMMKCEGERPPSGKCPELDCSLCPPVLTSFLSRLGF